MTKNRIFGFSAVGALVLIAAFTLLSRKSVISFSNLDAGLAGPAYHDVTTYHYDNARTGADASERTLTPANVNAASFGKLYSVAVDGQIYAQPLYYHGTLYAVTMNDSLYAISPSNGNVLWQKNFTDPRHGILPVAARDIGNYEIGPQIGILGTPVIDSDTNTIYFVAKTRKAGLPRATYADYLHAIDLATGNEKFNGPELISSPGPEPFDPILQNQRSALLLWNDTVYIAWASYGDAGAYHGWIIGYDAHDITKQFASLNVTPGGSAGGIWMAGGGLAADGTNLYAAVGNGTFAPSKRNYGESLLKLDADLTILDSFTPADQSTLTKNDDDFGSTEPIIIPADAAGGASGIPLLVAGDKTGKVFILDRGGLGGFSSSTNNDFQDIFTGAMLMNNMAFFDNALYVGTNNSPIEAFSLGEDHYFSSLPVSTTSISFGNGAMNGEGANPIVSANGTKDAILWALDNSGFKTKAPAVLHAFDAHDLSRELWNSATDAARNAAGPAVKFTSALVADGRVFVPGNGALTVYGLLR